MGSLMELVISSGVSIALTAAAAVYWARLWRETRHAPPNGRARGLNFPSGENRIAHKK
jgi:hypothetical protein